MPGLYWNTVAPDLKSLLTGLIASPIFSRFRLVGGTALSLQLGHRKSVDIDLFTDAPYQSIDFNSMDSYLRDHYKYVSNPTTGPIAFGRSYFIGDNDQQAIKVDIYYTDPFIRDPINPDNIRMATTEEITAMKIDVIQRGGRKKDFWDIHELMDTYTIKRMIALHSERYHYTHDEQKIRKEFMNFAKADIDFDPVCLRGKYWELIKLDILEECN
jgi:predicted nucleotidyltransferase component of viral defense system